MRRATEEGEGGMRRWDDPADEDLLGSDAGQVRFAGYMFLGVGFGIVGLVLLGLLTA
jgi:hypothetical protein